MTLPGRSGTDSSTVAPSRGARGSLRGGVRGVRKRTFRNIISGKGFEAKEFVSAAAPPEETKGNESPTPSTRSQARALPGGAKYFAVRAASAASPLPFRSVHR